MTGQLDSLLSNSPPWVMACRGGDDLSREIDRIDGAVSENAIAMLIVIDGASCKTVNDFYTHLQKGLALPNYFGRNLNALADCMEDVMTRDVRPLIIRIINADDFFLEASVDAFHGFLSTFSWIGSAWSAGINEGAEWDCPPRKLAVVLEYRRVY